MMTSPSTNCELALPAPTPGCKPPRLVPFAAITPEAISWLWPQRVARGRLTLLVGERGLGQSGVAADLAARVSRGSAWPDQPETLAPQGSVIVVCHEEAQRRSMPLQLQAAGADLQKVAAIAYDAPEGGCLPQFEWGYKLAVLRSALEATADCELVVVDPISSFFDGPDGRLRGATAMLVGSLAALAHRFRVPIVVVADIDGVASMHSIRRLLASFGPSSIERNAWGIFVDSSDPGRRIMAPLDGNLAEEQSCLSYRLAPLRGHVEWGDRLMAAPRSLFGAGRRFCAAAQSYQDKEAFTMERLREVLADGPVARTSIMIQVSATEQQLYRAGRRLGVVSEKKGFLNGWTWMLPEHYAQWQADQIERQRQEAAERIERKRLKREAARAERSQFDTG